MKICRLTNVVLVVFIAHFNAISLAGERNAVAAPFGEYIVVDLRNASYVASIASNDAAVDRLGQRVSFRENQLIWLGGKTCERWSVREVDAPVLMLDDPNLSDLKIPPLDSETTSGDKRVNMSVDLICQDGGEKILGSFVIVDARVLVTSVLNGAVNMILEHPLTKNQISKFQTQLKDMKFYDGKITGTLGEATLRSVANYAEYRGANYKFLRTVITENLLDGLRVLDQKK
jgi:hypothetical protein